MNRCVTLAVYGCTVAGERTESVDFQVRLLDAASVEGAERQLRAEPTYEYLNGDGEVVAWPLALILDVQVLNAAVASGMEVAGAITSLEEIESHLSAAAV